MHDATPHTEAPAEPFDVQAEMERLDVVTRLNACLLEGDTSVVNVPAVEAKIDECLERRFALMQTA